MNYKSEITAIINKGGLCSRKEYERIRKEIKSLSPCRLLVFGLGHDSEWLASLNEGETIFVENSQKWIEANQGKGLQIVHVSYNSRHLNDGKLHPEHLLIMPEIVELGEFDLVFVDAPIGKTQGRMKSIATAFKVGERVIVHDYDRPTEKMYVDHYAKGDVEVVERLGIV